MNNYTRNVTEKGVQADSPFTNPTILTTGVQTTPYTKTQHSLEAIRAVQEYKRRQEEEKRRTTRLEDTIRADEFTERISQNRTNTEPSFYRQQNLSPTLRSSSKPVNQDQLINNYYNSIVRKSRETPEVKTVHDLYKNRPKHGK